MAFDFNIVHHVLVYNQRPTLQFLRRNLYGAVQQVVCYGIFRNHICKCLRSRLIHFPRRVHALHGLRKST